MNQHYCHPGDLHTEWDQDDPRRLALFDCDGNFLWLTPVGWTEEMARSALDFANRAYETGFRMGEHNKAYEIRKALGVGS